MELITRFEDLETMDIQDQFNKLKQVGMVTEYEGMFEESRALVLSKNKVLNKEYFLSIFISGLKDHIKGSFKIFKPQILYDAILLAK